MTGTVPGAGHSPSLQGQRAEDRDIFYVRKEESGERRRAGWDGGGAVCDPNCNRGHLGTRGTEEGMDTLCREWDG